MIRPHGYQADSIARVRAAYLRGRRAPCLVLPCGGGKCLGIGTPVLRYDGTITTVESVRPGDLLMGPDSKPRRVLSTTRGHSDLYRIVPVKGEPWVCNDVHVLTLVNMHTDKIVDVDIPSYLGATKTFRHTHKQFTPERGIDFEPGESLPLDPYFVGVWYGDGTKSLVGVAISKPDQEILALCHEVASRFGLHVRTDHGVSGCPTHHIVGSKGVENPLLTLLRGIVGDGRSLPHRYLTANRSDRLAFLAGLLDTDGYMHRSGFEIVQKQRGFADGICFLARSLGLRALVAIKVVNGDTYWRISISGDCSVIPNRIPRKKAPRRRQIKCATRTGFTIEPIGHGEYAGFELDGDGRFLLGDFTVTHNTIVAAFIILAAIQRGTRVLFVADRCTLIDQTVAKLELVGVTGVRIIQAHRDDGPRDALVTVASAQTLRLRTELPEADLVIWDEVHHVIADTYAATVARYPAAKFLGLTATPCRGDNRPLDICDELVVGATIRQLTELGHLARCRVIAPDRELEPGEIAQSPLDAWRKQAEGRRAAVFWARVDEATRDAEAFRAAGVTAEVITAKTKNRAGILARFAAGDIQILESVGTLTEGWDDKECSFAIVARRPQHVGMWLQICGRVLRAAPGKTHGIISDLRGTVWDPAFGKPDEDREYSLDGKGIRPVTKDAIRHCSTCGSISDYGPRACPFCGTEYPVRPRAMARVVGVEMAEVGAEAKRPAKPMRPIPMNSNRGGYCRKCAQWFPAGTPIWWAKGKQPQHQQCPPPSVGVSL